MKKTGARYREHARVVMQLNGGYTKITFERTHGSGMADGGIDWDVPTERIPRHLRAIGSRFVFVFEPAAPEKDESADSIRSCRDDFFVIEEISALA